MVLTRALSLVEQRLCEDFSQEALAADCYCSLSQLQKLFRYVFHVSIGEYVTKRRMSLAARELVNTSRSVTEIALEYGYNAPEVFSRAFVRTWGLPPARFRRERRFTDIYPKLNLILEGNALMTREKFDISELYDYLRQSGGTYALAFDVVSLLPVNRDYGRAAGDKVIVESLRRIEAAFPSPKTEGTSALRCVPARFASTAPVSATTSCSLRCGRRRALPRAASSTAFFPTDLTRARDYDIVKLWKGKTPIIKNGFRAANRKQGG